VAEYPAHLVREHRLFDGRTVTIRPVRPDDAVRVRDLLDESSEETRYQRFQKGIHAPSDKLIHFLTEIDYDRHMAFVCSVPHGEREQLVGEARYVANPDGKSCELGIMVADAWSKTGIAGLLMEAIIVTARERGLAIIEGLVLSTNSSMLRFARALGFEVHSVPEDRTTVHIMKKL
jgi:acetyltransferase